MAIAFDAVSTDITGWGSGGQSNISHTPVGTPKGIIAIVTCSDTSDGVTGITYGGTAMTRVASATILSSTSGEGGSVYIYFLGSSVPTGNQTAILTATVTDGSWIVISVTAAADTEVDAGATLDSAGVANPAVTLATTAATETFICGAIYSGQGAVGGIAPGADYTEIGEADLGAMVTSFIRRTSNGAGGNVTVDWTATSDDAVVGAVAIKEAGTATYSATAALTVGGLDSASTIEFDPPVFSATAALTLGGLELAGAAEGPLFAATAALILGGLEFAGVGQRQCTCTVTMPLAGLQMHATTMTASATYTASAALTFGGLRAVANMEGPLFAITAPLTLGNLEAAAAMTFTDADNYASVAAATLGNLELAAVMDFTAPNYVIAAALALPGLTGKAFMTASCHVEVASVAARVRHRRRIATVSHARRYSRASHQKDTC